jgi:hypothetical protein
MSTWDAWKAAERGWKATHPIAERDKGWRQRMLTEVGAELGGTRPRPPIDDEYFGYGDESECEKCGADMSAEMYGIGGTGSMTPLEWDCPGCGATWVE